MNALDDTPVARSNDDALLTEIDRALEGAAPGSPGVAGVISRLTASAPQAPGSFRDALHQRLLSELDAQLHSPMRTAVGRLLPRGRGFRGALVAGAVTIGLVGGWILSPASGGWAQQNVGRLVRQLGFSTGPVPLSKQIPPVYSDNLTLDQTTTMLGFRPAVPSYLPDAYPGPTRFTVYALQRTSPRSVWWRTLKDNGPWWGPNRITLVQDPLGVGALPGKLDQIGSTPAMKVQVQGVDGLWLQMPDQIDTDSNGKRTVSRYKYVLRWEKGGFRYTLSVPVDTDLSVALRIANSLH